MPRAGDFTVDVVERAVADVLRSRRYRWVAPALVRRLAAEEASKAHNAAGAGKRTKRRLHQILGAYVNDLRPAPLLAMLSAAHAADLAEGTPGAHLKEACLAAMAAHASTRERLPLLDRFYREVFQVTGRPRTVLDVACGLGPLAWPWMDLPAPAWYAAYDADARLVEVVDGFLTLCGVPHTADLRDVIAQPPDDGADVALLLKSAPCLEQQAPGAAGALLDALRCRFAVLSYPTHSLGGAARGMVAHYRQQVQATLAHLHDRVGEVQEIVFPQELAFVVRLLPTLGSPAATAEHAL